MVVIRHGQPECVRRARSLPGACVQPARRAGGNAGARGPDPPARKNSIEIGLNMEYALSPEVLAMLFAAAAIAGFVDAIAGGGGLITIPVLLLAQVPPLQALATNK